MIVKTGANYQAEGGYIEFARGVGTAIVNGAPIPSIVYSDSKKVMGMQEFSITRKSGVSGTLRYVTYVEYTASTGEKFYDYNSISIDEGATQTITLPSGFGSYIVSPEGYHPKVAEDSKNVKIVKGWSPNLYYLISTGDFPTAVIELEANE